MGRGYEFVYDGWKGVYKVGQEYHGEDKNDLFEGEFKIPMSWPISSIASWLTGFRKSYLLNETDARKREDAAKDTIIGLVFSTPQFYDLATQVDEVQKQNSWAAKNIEDEAGYGDKGAGLAFRLKVEEKPGGKAEVTLSAGTQADLDKEYGEQGPVKIGAKGKFGQTFVDKKFLVSYE